MRVTVRGRGRRREKVGNLVNPLNRAFYTQYINTNSHINCQNQIHLRGIVYPNQLVDQVKVLPTQDRLLDSAF